MLQMEDEMNMDEELEREMEEEEDMCVQIALERDASIHQPITKVLSLPADFTFHSCQSLHSSGTYLFFSLSPLWQVRLRCSSNLIYV